MTNHEKHILLWDELARTGSMNKSGTFYKLFTISRQSGYCWACEDCGCACSLCPIDWGNGAWCLDEDTLYDQWCEATEDIEDRKLLAAQIRDLPWRTK
jgi:hypothetical protein